MGSNLLKRRLKCKLVIVSSQRNVLIPVAIGDRQKENALKLHLEKFRLDNKNDPLDSEGY